MSIALDSIKKSGIRTQLNIWVTPKFKARVKAATARDGVQIRRFVIQAIENHLATLEKRGDR